MANEVEHLCMYLFAICISSSVKLLFVFAYFLMRFFFGGGLIFVFFLLLSFESS